LKCREERQLGRIWTGLFHLKHRETRHLAAGLVEARPVSGSGEVKKRTGSFDYSPVRGFRVARCIAKAGPSL
jgi:hypothetical protein